ncbi:ComF family protein [Devosia sp. RR2S18]|uniref:ComF family protein n=1 Tax=Devosia rhizosphaerae TaxID=3049774 RepID=UPI00254099A0|nr:ComF family protein [Devosia sp. RR2S18]WIJ25668.1 ComF family protein [Devosia sp. RR2S18]
MALSISMESAEGLVKSEGLRSRLGNGLRRLSGLALDMLYPPVCLACQAPTGVADTLCAGCFTKLRPITAPYCPRLGIPFEVSLGEGALSAEALADPPPFGRARAAVVYNEVARSLVGQLKYGDRPELASFCARLMVGAGHEFWDGAPLLVPVPLHPRRLRARRYNQSAELARVLGALTKLPVDADLVRRKKHTRQQVGLSGAGRERNVAGAFAVHPDVLTRAKGRRIILIDDVYTTGATIKAVTRTLLRAGIEAIDVVTFARVVIGADETI